MPTSFDLVLLIDDEAGTNLLNQKIVDNARVTEFVEVRLNGQQAIHRLAELHTQAQSLEIARLHVLIFLDINMPVMDGWEFLESFESFPLQLKESCTIVMLTTSFNPDDKSRAQKHPAVHKYLIKPLTPQKFENLLKIGRHGPN